MEETADHNVLLKMREKLEDASKAVLMENISIRASARRFGVPPSTLQRHIKNPSLKDRGRPRKFTTAEYDTIADLLLRFADVGGNINKDLMLKVVLAVGKAKGLTESVNKFGQKWTRTFLVRYPAVAARMSRKKPSRWDPDKWDQLMEQLEKDAFLEDPRKLFPYSPEGIWRPPKKRISKAESAAALLSPAKLVPKTPQQILAERKKKTKTFLMETWTGVLAEADVVRLVNEMDFMARGLIPSVQLYTTAPPGNSLPA